MQCENFNPRDYDGLADLAGNQRVTLMAHRQTESLIVRKSIDRNRAGIYRQLSRVRHPHLAAVLCVEETPDGCYTYEEYVQGKTLAETLKNGPVPEKTALNWIGQLCQAVRCLHEQKPVVIHRDIKPSNVILSDAGQIKLIDFDAAKEFASRKAKDTELIGTPQYAAPEQYGFGSSDPRTDIYAIGVLFHELLTGSKPGESPTPYRGRYRSAIYDCIAVDPGNRHPSIQALERRLGLRLGLSSVPGFRTGVWWKKAIAVTFYAVAFLLFLVALADEKPLPMFLVFVSLLGPIYVFGTNLFSVRRRLPLLRSNSAGLMTLGAILYILIWSALFCGAYLYYWMPFS